MTRYLSKVQPHLFPVEVGLVQAESGLGRSQSVAEADPHPPEGLEVLELHLGVEGAEQGLKSDLKTQRGGRGGRYESILCTSFSLSINTPHCRSAADINTFMSLSE